MEEGSDARHTLLGSALLWSVVLFLGLVARRWITYVPLFLYGVVSAYAAAQHKTVVVTASDVSLCIGGGVLVAGAKVFHDLRIENQRLRGSFVNGQVVPLPARFDALIEEGKRIKRFLAQSDEPTHAQEVNFLANEWSGRAAAFILADVPDCAILYGSDEGFGPWTASMGTRTQVAQFLDRRLFRLSEIKAKL